MLKKERWVEHIKPYRFILKFVTLYCFLYILFPLLRGAASPDGKFYSFFIDHHFNIVKALSSFLTSAARILLETIGYKASQNDYHTLRIAHARGVIINPSCLGWALMSFWSAFVMANVGSSIYKIKWIFVGILSIISLNIFRIALIAVANYSNWKLFYSIDQHLLFNIASYVCIFFLIISYLYFLRIYDKRKIIMAND